MPALLTSIVFDDKTRQSLLDMAEQFEETEQTLQTLDSFAALEGSSVTLDKLPDGDYTLIVKMYLEENTSVQLTLIQSNSRDIVKQADFDTQPIIETSEAYRNYFCGPTVTGEAPRSQRIPLLGALLTPYIADNDTFNNKLLDALDFGAQSHVVKMVFQDATSRMEKADKSINRNLSEVEESLQRTDALLKSTAPLNRHLPQSKLLH